MDRPSTPRPPLRSANKENYFAAYWARAVYAAALVALAAPRGALPGRAPDECFARRVAHLCLILTYPLMLVTGPRYVHVFVLLLWQVWPALC